MVQPELAAKDIFECVLTDLWLWPVCLSLLCLGETMTVDVGIIKAGAGSRPTPGVWADRRRPAHRGSLRGAGFRRVVLAAVAFCRSEGGAPHLRRGHRVRQILDGPVHRVRNPTDAVSCDNPVRIKRRHHRQTQTPRLLENIRKSFVRGRRG